MKKKIKPIIYLTCFLVAAGTLYSFTNKTYSSNSIITSYDDKKIEWKNLKVLPKDISADSLLNLMHYYEDALGVGCAFCHASKMKKGKRKFDFASDKNKVKDVARYMITMTMEINEKYFSHHKKKDENKMMEVRCMTCHRGSAHPNDLPLPNKKDNKKEESNHHEH